MTPQQENLRDKILADLKKQAKGRWYKAGVSDRLRAFVEECVPEVEIVKHAGGELLRMKK